MKKITLISFLILPLVCLSQVNPPTNVIVSPNQISGNADFNSTVKVDLLADDTVDYTIVVNYQGYFELSFNPILQIANGSYPNVNVWCEDSSGNKSSLITSTPQNPQQILNNLTNGTLKLPSKIAPVVPEPPTEQENVNPGLFEKQPKSSKYFYSVKMVSTNFTIPVARFNMAKEESNGNKIGDLTLFNSIGAGIGYSWGELEITTDENSEVIDREFVNNIGISGGILFSAGSGSEAKNIFAPTLTVSTLDIQFGVGYELGTIVDNQSRFFFTVAYAIPLSKLIKGKYYIKSASRGYNSKHPLPIEDNSRTEVNAFK